MDVVNLPIAFPIRFCPVLSTMSSRSLPCTLGRRNKRNLTQRSERTRRGRGEKISDLCESSAGSALNPLLVQLSKLAISSLRKLSMSATVVTSREFKIWQVRLGKARDCTQPKYPRRELFAEHELLGSTDSR